MATTRLGEVRDQGLHALYAICLMYAFINPIHPVLALVLTMIIAVLRELEQHKWTTVGKLDLAMWAMAGSFFLVFYYALT